MNDDQFKQLMEKLEKIRYGSDNSMLTWIAGVIFVVYVFNGCSFK